jgi:tRNA pseudouridine55 synthase
MEQGSSGILVVDKPADMTSARLVAVVKKLSGARKAGHAGTLDPFATGVMVCCLNKATRLARFFLHGRKIYETVLCLGVETDTQDSTGTITSTCDKLEFSEKTIRTILKRFEGPVKQYPPVYSALKHKGIPLYKLARSGKPVQKPARGITVYSINRIEINLPEVHFEISCSAGTYIRTLCTDIGRALGCGGHLKALRRIESSRFSLQDAITLPEMEDCSLSGTLSNRLISMADALKGMPEHIADGAFTKHLRAGAIVTENDFPSGGLVNPGGFIKVVDTNKGLIAVLNRIPKSSRFRYCCVFPG